VEPPRKVGYEPRKLVKPSRDPIPKVTLATYWIYCIDFSQCSQPDGKERSRSSFHVAVGLICSIGTAKGFRSLLGRVPGVGRDFVTAADAGDCRGPVRSQWSGVRARCSLSSTRRAARGWQIHAGLRDTA
jgi:hypothetical protein